LLSVFSSNPGSKGEVSLGSSCGPSSGGFS
jgi:hypothetical protein